VLSRAIFAIRDAFDRGERSTAVLEALGNALVSAERQVELEYLAVMNPDTLEPVALATPGCIVAIAARIGKTRLIDNVILGAPDDTE
jgi:pantoate--beta-alanine ligase